MYGTAWDVYREMWGSDGEFVVDGNLKEVEYVGRLTQIKLPNRNWSSCPTADI